MHIPWSKTTKNIFPSKKTLGHHFLFMTFIQVIRWALLEYVRVFFKRGSFLRKYGIISLLYKKTLFLQFQPFSLASNSMYYVYLLVISRPSEGFISYGKTGYIRWKLVLSTEQFRNSCKFKCDNYVLQWWVGCLLTDSGLPETWWKSRKWEKQTFWEEFRYFLQIR